MEKSKVLVVSKSPSHSFSKQNATEIKVIEGLGVEGDAHSGEKVQHLSRIKQNPDQPNLRQVHLVESELFKELKDAGYEISPGDIGENIATVGISLIELPKSTLLHIGIILSHLFSF